MFIRYFAELSIPSERVEEVLLRDASEWIPGLAVDAGDHGARLSADVGIGPEGHRVTKTVSIDVGDATRLGEKTVLPLIWRAAGAEALFPVMEGDLEVAPLGPNRTQLAMSARYQPPLGPVGRAIDRAVMHRVAEATIKDFVDRVAAAIEARAASDGVGQANTEPTASSSFSRPTGLSTTATRSPGEGMNGSSRPVMTTVGFPSPK